MPERSKTQLNTQISGLLTDSGANRRITPALHRAALLNVVDSANTGRAVIRAKDNPNQGVRLSFPGADSTWGLETVNGNGPTAPELDLTGQTDGTANFLEITLPDLYIRRGFHAARLLVQRAQVTTSPAVSASTVLVFSHSANSGVRVTRLVDTGAASNGKIVNVIWSASIRAVAHASYESADQINLTVSNTGFVSSVIQVINNARWNGVQYFEAEAWNGGSGQTTLVPNGHHTTSGGRDALVTSREPLSFDYDDDDDTLNRIDFKLIVDPSDTLGDIRDVIEAYSFHGSTPFADAVSLDGSDEDTLDTDFFPIALNPGLSVAHEFTGYVAADAVSVVSDDTLKMVTLTYVSDFHWLSDLIGTYDTASIVKIPGSNLHQTIEDPKVVGFDFSESDSFDATQENLYDGVKSILLHNDGISADDDDYELDLSDLRVPGALSLSLVVDHDLTSATTSTGIDVADLNDVIYLAFEYRTQSTANLHFVTSFLKADIGPNATPARIQLQGGGASYIGISQTTAGVLRFGGLPATYDQGSVRVYNATAGNEGPAGEAGTMISEATVTFWQDTSATSSPPGSAETETVNVGQGLYALRFKAVSSNRFIHVLVDDAYELEAVSFQSRNQLNRFTTRTVGGNRIYDSPSVRERGLIDLLVSVVEA